MLELAIESMAYGGKGVARKDGKVYFVPDAVPGDVVRAEVTDDHERYADAIMDSLATASPLRGTPVCPYAFHEGGGSCGGCQWMGIDYAKQLEWKRSFVVSALTRIGKLPADVDVKILGAPEVLGYRNRILVRLHVGAEGSIQLGYFQRRSRDLVAIERCAIAASPINALLAGIRALDLQGPGPFKSRLELQEITDAGVVVTVYPAEGAREAQEMLVARIAALPGVAWCGLVSQLSDAPTVLLDDDEAMARRFLTIPGQFQQVNLAHNRTLRRLVKDRVDASGAERILDVFCGSGNLSLPLADGRRYVEGVESNKKAIVVAKKNAAANLLANVKYLAGDAEAHLWKTSRAGERFDLVILDPPRQGVYKGMVPLKNLAPRDIIYVSCDPTTLARDLGYLVRGDAYRLEAVTALDFFPNTYHVETVAFLRLKSSPG